jgi:hypothetical protein
VLGHEVHRIGQSGSQSEGECDGHCDLADQALPYEPIAGFWTLHESRSSYRQDRWSSAIGTVPDRRDRATPVYALLIPLCRVQVEGQW